MKKLLYSLILFIFGVPLWAKVPSENKIRLTQQWEYVRGDLGGIWEAVRPFGKGSPESVPLWEKVTLPHCFNAEDAVDPDVNYYEGPGWYRTTLELKNPYADGRILLDFEGAGQKTEVYLYTTLVGSHVGGYDEWTVDITDAVHSFMANPKLVKRFKGKVPLTIRCDNTRDVEMIPSDLADFNVYGGLYRYVNLVYVPKVAFSNLKITPTLSPSRKEGEVTISASFLNPDDVKKVDVQIRVLSPAGECVADETVAGLLPLGDQPLLTLPVKKPVLWDVDAPQLYTCELTLDVDGQRLVASEKFGFRQFEFQQHGPFLLNGRRVLLRGTHRHEDHAGVGAAMTEEMMKQEIRLMKEMGVNFIRLGHYQQSSIILDLCDEMGILVWEEIPWCRGGLGGERYQAQARRMLTHMITQHHNHPAVIIWGLGNENDWPNDFSSFDKGAIRSFMKELHDLAHQLDDTRKTAIRRCAFCNDIVDVYSPSIWAGWYRGVFTDYKSISEEEMKKVNHFLHVEWGGDSHARRHSENVFDNIRDIKARQGGDERAGDASMYGGPKRASKDGNWSESYIVRLMDWHLKEQETMPWLTGAAFWIFKDFSTPVRPQNPVPYVNQKGVVERDFTKKEAYYVFQSYWTTQPMVHIYGHSWPVRWGEKDEQKEVLVYSNCPEVELFVNGVSVGRKKRNSQDYPAAGLHWNVNYQEGNNLIEAVGYADKKEYKDKINQKYQSEKWEAPTTCRLKVAEVKEGVALVEATVYDKHDVQCLDAKDWITFGLVGDGKMIQNQGTSTGSRKVQLYNGRALIRVHLNGGRSVLSAKVKNLPVVFTNLGE